MRIAALRCDILAEAFQRGPRPMYFPDPFAGKINRRFETRQDDHPRGEFNREIKHWPGPFINLAPEEFDALLHFD